MEPEADPRSLQSFRFVAIADSLKSLTIVSKEIILDDGGFGLASSNDMKLSKQV